MEVHFPFPFTLVNILPVFIRVRVVFAGGSEEKGGVQKSSMASIQNILQEMKELKELKEIRELKQTKRQK